MQWAGCELLAAAFEFQTPPFAMTDPVRVALRIRPFAQRELLEGCEQALSALDGSTVLVGSDRPFTFDHVFGGSASQSTLYETAIQPLIAQCLSGYNATVLAYGQTGSGKTHSMMGAGQCGRSSSLPPDEHAGIIPRVINDLFTEMASRASTVDFTVTATFCELYKEELIDLLDSTSDKIPAIREDTAGNVMVTGLKEVELSSPSDALATLASGFESRSTGATRMNAHSSRSHAVFTLTVEQNPKPTGGDDGEDGYKISKFNLVDLAGSERQKKTQAEGDRLREAVHINRGLLALGNVINALTEQATPEAHHRHVPYRDSKLTRLLQDSLGGNSRTVMLACVSPADGNFEESLNTLRYASRARGIQNRAVVNTDPQAAQVAALRTQIRELQVALVQARGGNAAASSSGSVTADGAASTGVGAGSASGVMQAVQRVQELESLNKALRADLLQQYHTVAGMRESMMSLAQRLLEAEVQRDTIVAMHESSAGDPSTPSPDIEAVSSVSVVEAQRRRIHELEMQLMDRAAAAAATVSTVVEGTPSDGSDAVTVKIEEEFNTKQQSMLSELAEMSNNIKSKQDLLEAYVKSDIEMDSMKRTYEASILRLEADIAKLQEEKVVISSKAPTGKRLPAEQKRQLEELESRLELLSSKLKEANKMVSMKAKSEEKAAKLAEEIASMKAAKVSLLKRLEDEAKRFSKLRAEKDREVSNLKRDQSRKEYEIKKLEATNQKQAAVIQRKTEQLQAVQAKAKTASDLAQYAAAKREERDAERAKKIEAMKAQRVPIAAQPPKPPTPASGGEKAIAPAKPKDASTSETAVAVAPNGEISRLIEAALTSTASDALPEPLLASLRKEIIGKSSLARSNQLVATYIAARRETTKRCHAAKEMGAPEEEIQALQATISKLSCDISVLQGVISHMDREMKVPHQSQRWTNHVTDVRVAKSAITCLISCIGALAESTVSTTAAFNEAKQVSADKQAELQSSVQMAEKRAHALERRLLTEQIEAEQRVIALLSHKMGTVTQAITDELPSVDELRLDMETAKQEINVLSSKYEQLIVLDDIATAAAVPAKSSAEKKKRVKSSSRQPSDDSDYSDSISSSEDDVEWVPSPQRRLQAAADRRKRAAERAAKQSTGSGRSSTGSDASQASDTITTSPTRTEEPVVKPEEAAAEKEAPVIETGPCKCKFMCVRFCGCRSGGRQCDETCGCKPGKCKNRPKLTAGSSASPVIPTSITVPVAADSVNSEDDFEFVPQPLTKAQEAVSSAPPAVGEDTRVAATEKDLENVINKAPSKMKKLFNPSAPAMVSLTVTEKRKLKAAVQGTADAPLSTTAALDL